MSHLLNTALPVIQPSEQELLDILETHDNSMLSTWRRCELLYYYLYVLRRRPADQPLYFDYGTLWHEGLDVYYLHLASGASTIDATVAAIERLKAFEFREDPSDFRTRARAMKMFPEYVAHWRKEDNDHRFLMTETPFDVDLGHFPYGGRLDLFTDDNGLWIWDHKTTARFGATYFERYFPDGQTCGYAAAMSQLHGKPVRGVLLNVIVTRKNNHEFHRKKFTYDEHYIETWTRQTLLDLKRIAIARHTGEYSNMGWESCIDRRYQQKCPAYNVCRVPPEYRDSMIFGPFWEDNTWDWRKDNEDRVESNG